MTKQRLIAVNVQFRVKADAKPHSLLTGTPDEVFAELITRVTVQDVDFCSQEDRQWLYENVQACQIVGQVDN